ncbi:MAG: aspartate-semialdehyde dehydrogenase [Deltaproteobacteria bacterium]|nr:aspartate-semialdehyde dehydrogenase [Deltaproteobacteria bacterium]HCH62182.1 aspartate-semialdehyde dehydrogenase [Deltaproteobacteria bacterium]
MRVGFVGWRGMVGSTLRARMTEQKDWVGLEASFFSTSSPGGPPPQTPGAARQPPPLLPADNLSALSRCEAIVTCQGSAWTRAAHPQLRAAGWKGAWIDAASALRMEPDSTIVLDPINRPLIDAALAAGKRDFVGGNCTVSLLLMGLGGLFRADLVRFLSTMTYQAASGAGAQKMVELVHQMHDLGKIGAKVAASSSALDVAEAVAARMHHSDHPTGSIGYPLAGNLLPWIDAPLEDGRSREEWKGQAESTRILGRTTPVPIDGLAVRVGSLRCHAQAVTIGLTRPADLDEIAQVIQSTSPWTHLVPNTPEATQRQLTPAAVTGTMTVAVGRLRRLHTAPDHIGLLTLGDQLLWGAAEPVRRMLRIWREHTGQ